MTITLFTILFMPIFGLMSIVISSMVKPKNLFDLLSILVVSAIAGLIFTLVGYSLLFPVLLKMRVARSMAVFIVQKINLSKIVWNLLIAC